jgi:hypothetical protein
MQLSSEQVRNLHELSSVVPPPFDAAVCAVPENQLKDCLVESGVQGSKATEIPFSDLVSACERVRIDLCQLSAKNRTTLLSALCRNAATKIINLTLFFALYKRWHTLATRSNTSSPRSRNQPTVSADVSLYLSEDRAGLTLLLDVIRDRLFPADLRRHQYAKWMPLSAILKLCAVKVSSLQKGPLLEYLQTVNVGHFNAEQSEQGGDDIDSFIVDMEQLKVALNQLNPHRPISSANGSNDNIVIRQANEDVTRLIRSLAPQAKRLIRELEYSAHTDQDVFVSAAQFKSAVRNVGVILGHDDCVRLWDYFRGTTSNGVGTVSLDVLKESLLNNQVVDKPKTSILSPVMRDHAPVRSLKAAESGNTSLVDNVSGVIRSRPQVGEMNAEVPKSGVRRVSETFNSHQYSDGLTWSKDQTRVQSNPSVRFRQRVSDLPTGQQQGFALNIIKIDHGPVLRDLKSAISDALTSSGLRHTHKDTEQLVLDIRADFGCTFAHQTLSSRQVLEWFGIWSADMEYFLNDRTQNEESERPAGAYRIRSQQDNMRNSSAPSSRRHQQGSYGVSPMQLYHHHRDQQTAEAASPAKVDSAELESRPELTRYVQSTRPSRASTDDIDSTASNAPDSVHSSVRVGITSPIERSSSIVESHDLYDKNMIEAINIMMKQRPVIAFLFKKLLAVRPHQEVGVKCSTLAAALIEPPLSLPLSYEQSLRLCNDMAEDDPTWGHWEGFIDYTEVSNYLDKCNKESVDAMLVHQQIRQKLMNCSQIEGDSVRLMALTPLLRQRYNQKKQQTRAGTRDKFSSWEPIPDYINFMELQSLLASIGLNLTRNEAAVVCYSSDSNFEFSYGEHGASLAAAIKYLCELIKKKNKDKFAL